MKNQGLLKRGSCMKVCVFLDGGGDSFFSSVCCKKIVPRNPEGFMKKHNKD